MTRPKGLTNKTIRHTIYGMGWGKVELEDEVTQWLESLNGDDFGTASRYIDLLETQGVHLDEPYTRQLKGKLRELRFHLRGQQRRITYFIASDRRIILLTTFRKTRNRETLEVWRAEKAMETCLREHRHEEDQ
jgi:hypothetical protein